MREGLMADLMRGPCPTCGAVHTKCTGHRKSDKQPCGMNPAEGADVCRMHGGGAPQVKAKATERAREGKLRRVATTYGGPRDVGPEDFLLELVTISAGHVWWLRDIIGELDPEALVYGERQTSHQAGHGPEGPVDVTTTVHGAALSEWIELYLKEREHGRKVSTDALRAGIAQRQIDLAAQAGERAGQWLQACLAVLPNVTPEDVRRVMAEAPRHLHLLESAG